MLLGCNGVAWSCAVYDDCTVCLGNNSCFACNAEPNSGYYLDSCGCCQAPNSTNSSCPVTSSTTSSLSSSLTTSTWSAISSSSTGVTLSTSTLASTTHAASTTAAATTGSDLSDPPPTDECHVVGGDGSSCAGGTVEWAMVAVLIGLGAVVIIACGIAWFGSSRGSSTRGQQSVVRHVKRK